LIASRSSSTSPARKLGTEITAIVPADTQRSARRPARYADHIANGREIASAIANASTASSRFTGKARARRVDTSSIGGTRFLPRSPRTTPPSQST
jgi:hypothetical protein